MSDMNKAHKSMVEKYETDPRFTPEMIEKIKLAAKKILIEKGLEEKKFNSAKNLSKKPSPEQRKLAINILKHYPDGVKIVRDMTLYDPDIYVRITAINSLDEFNLENIQTLSKITIDEEEITTVRRTAFYKLINNPKHKFVQATIKHLIKKKDSDEFASDMKSELASIIKEKILKIPEKSKSSPIEALNKF